MQRSAGAWSGAVEQCDQQNGSESHQNQILKDVGEGHQSGLLLKDTIDGGQSLGRAVAERCALHGEETADAAQILEQEGLSGVRFWPSMV